MRPDVYEKFSSVFCACGMVVVFALCIAYPGALWEWIKETRGKVPEEYNEAGALTVRYVGIGGLFISLLFFAIVMRGILN
jgi:hypothetical protein